MIYVGQPKEGGIPVAKIFRPETGRSLFGGVHDYYLTVAPNVDVSMLVAMCICLDELRKD